MTEVYSRQQVERIQEDYNFWCQFEHDDWKLISFTDRISARFGWMVKGQFTRYAEIKASNVKFLRGVAPDLLDQL